MAFQVCCGLQYLHERGIYHRDIKPENILQTSDGQYMIGDFGISVVRRRRSTSSTSTALSSSTGILLDDRPLGVGTPLFMAPELLLAERSPVDDDSMFEEDNEPSERATYVAADMWALGVTLLALVFGKWPFESAGAFRLSPDAIVAAAVAKFGTIILRTPLCESHACYAARCAWKDVVAMLLSVDASKRPSASKVRKVSKELLLAGSTSSLCANCGDCFLDGALDAAPAKAASTTKSSTSEDDTNNSTSYHLDGLQITVGPEAVTRSMESGCCCGCVDEHQQQHPPNKNGSNAEFCCSHRGPSGVSSPTITRAPVDEDRSSSSTGTGNDDPLSRNERENHRNATVRRSTIYDSNQNCRW
ncbi:calcium calmodulin-dependent protein kinase kinase, putative [Bodo saltans]|uniref:non-specific serine/threonine protein kinase n=1 Tax=Bodo saltans TaxID=75058 RepID=A0A0S4JR89_BODSA|nr:calcium calmodulin-dependent protein kinase kinase, putative [Bodo saltans]|eukprot:CUG92702.1 calcium calmodulin-dependent protein kinase kinase, putative [Bodo saltans]